MLYVIHDINKAESECILRTSHNNSLQETQGTAGRHSRMFKLWQTEKNKDMLSCVRGSLSVSQSIVCFHI